MGCSHPQIPMGAENSPGSKITHPGASSRGSGRRRPQVLGASSLDFPGLMHGSPEKGFFPLQQNLIVFLAFLFLVLIAGKTP